jgi:hypothetical protein
MTNIPKTALYCAFAAAFALAVSSAALAQGMALEKMSLGHTVGEYTRKILVANEKVQVWDVVIRPGEAGPMQSREGMFIYHVTGGTLERTFADGSKQVVTRKTGEALVVAEKRPYSSKNIGRTTIHLISAAFAQDTAMSKMSSGQPAGTMTVKVLAENGMLLARDVIARPGDSSPMQVSPMRVVYFVTGGIFERLFKDGTQTVVDAEAGESRLLDVPLAYSLKNIGKSTVHLIELDIK